MCSMICFMGCVTTPQQSAAKTLSTVAITVDKLMQGWAQWVVVQRANPATDQAQLLRSEGNVKSAYETYQISMQTARAMYAAYVVNPLLQGQLDAAVANVTQQKNTLTATVNTIKK